MDVRAGFGDALRRVCPPTVPSYLQLRGWTHREILYNCSSVTFRRGNAHGVRAGQSHYKYLHPSPLRKQGSRERNRLDVRDETTIIDHWFPAFAGKTGNSSIQMRLPWA